MGQNTSDLAERGLDLGIMVGTATGTMTGCAARRAVSCALSIPDHTQSDCRVAVGLVVGGPVAFVVGLPCAVLGSIAGGLTGAAEDLRKDITGSIARALAGLLVPAARTVLNVASELQPGACSRLAQFPRQALPLLCALIDARRTGLLTEEEAFARAAGFAARCALDDAAEETRQRAELEARRLLGLVRLWECYPSEPRSALEEAAQRLAAEADSDSVDAAWAACGPEPLRQLWPSASLPSSASEVSPEVLRHFLEVRYQEERTSMASALRAAFPGGGSKDYEETLELLHANLPQSLFWRGYRLLQRPVQELSDLSGFAKAFSFQDLHHPKFLKRARAVLSDSSMSLVGVSATAVPASPALADAALRAQSPLAAVAMAAPGLAQGEVQVEVLRAEGIVSSEYCFGDLSAGLMGLRRLHPYVCVGLRHSLATKSTEVPKLEAKRTRTAATDSEGRAGFGESVSLPLGVDGVSGMTLDHLHLVFQVYDERSSVRLFGDPIIGDGSLWLSSFMLGESIVHTVSLSRNGTSQGLLRVRICILTPPAAVGGPAADGGQRLTAAAAACARLLAQPLGMALLLASRPEPLQQSAVEGAAAAREEAKLHEALQAWVAAFCARVARLGAEAGEEQVLEQLGLAVRPLRTLVERRAEECPDVEELMAAWFRGFRDRCTAAGHPPVDCDEGQLRRVLEASRVPGLRLEDLGVQLPRRTPAVVKSAVLERLLEAEGAEEREMFTGVPLVRGGRVASGMAAVVRHSPGTAPHVFLYATASIRKWQVDHRTDPCTREALIQRDIVPLSC